MSLCGVRERERKGWKLASPALLVLCAPASMLAEDSANSSSGRGGAPGSPGLGRLDEAVDKDTVTLPPPIDGASARLDAEGSLRDPVASDVEAHPSLSGWNSIVDGRFDSYDNVLERSLDAPFIGR